jgi:hypothetical protein
MGCYPTRDKVECSSRRTRRMDGKSPVKTTCQRHAICYIANSLRYTGKHSNQFGKAFIALLLVGMVLLLNAMAACPALHELIHADADKPGHECAVTIFAHGKVESATVEVPAIVPTASIESAPQIEFSIFSTAIEYLPLGRAPPAVISSQA